jgi:hypothetical protein
MIELVSLGTMTITPGETLRLAGTPAGDRLIVEFAGVDFAGERLNARLRGKAAADWIVIGADSTALIDIRFTLETHDGALLLVQMNGRTDASKFNAGGPLYMTPRFETGDARYAWLNRVQAISKGKLESGKIENDVYEAR